MYIEGTENFQLPGWIQSYVEDSQGQVPSDRKKVLATVTLNRIIYQVINVWLCIIIFRDRVMELMRALDRSGVFRRRSYRLQRRVYLSKVNYNCMPVTF